MLILLRIFFTGAMIYVGNMAAEVGHNGTQGGSSTEGLFLAILTVLGLCTGVAWAPFFGERLGRAITGTMTEGNYQGPSRYIWRGVQYCDGRRWRRLTVFLCFLEAVDHPSYPAPVLVGLRNAREGSWLEKFFAVRVFRFDNAQNSLWALEVLHRHGIKPSRHPKVEVELQLLAGQQRTSPPRTALVIPPSPPPEPLKRNLRIRLFGDRASKRR